MRSAPERAHEEPVIADFARARGFIRRHQHLSGTHVVPWVGGRAIFHQALPLVYDLNLLRAGSHCRLSAAEIAEVADDLMSPFALSHRQVVADSDIPGERLTGEFETLGWKVDRHMVMIHRRSPDLAIDTSEVQPVDERTVWPSRERFLRTYEWCNDAATVSQMQAAYRIWMQAGNGVDLAILRDGIPVSFAMLWSHCNTAQIEDVATIEGYRNRGLSRAVVTRAVRLANARGCDLVFLVADSQDWPKELYRKLGFEPAGFLYRFLKTNSYSTKTSG